MNFINSPCGDNRNEDTAFSAPVVVVLLCTWTLILIGVVALVALHFGSLK